MIPLLEYLIEGNTLHYRYTNIVKDFDMPVEVSVNSSSYWLFPAAEWKSESLEGLSTGLQVDPDYYIESKNLNEP